MSSFDFALELGNNYKHSKVPIKEFIQWCSYYKFRYCTTEQLNKIAKYLTNKEA